MSTFGYAKMATAAQDAFAPLARRLVEDGFSPDRISLIYSTNSTPLLNRVSGMFRIQESKLNYARFLEPSPLAEAKRFLERYETVLARAESSYGVDRSVIAAILLVETHFGQNTGKTPVLDVFSTFALMDEKLYRDQVWALLPYELRQQWGCYLFDLRLKKRAQWAYDELRALLKWTGAQPEILHSVQGSYMGAIGWPQFLPSSILKYGVDGNGDGRIDLYNSTDAVMSTANYLKAHGWREGASRPEQEEVIYYYNHSRPYVNTILDVADRLRL
jgi:membrane-bound lytic murein transglycosylase B